jgi:hypothetical protein
MDETHKMNLGWRVLLSIGVSIGWLIFIIIWLAFFALESFYQNVAIFFASILVMVTILGAAWASWGIKQIPEAGKEIIKTTGMRSRLAISIVVIFAFMIFLIIWFYFYAGTGYSPYQNLAIFLVSILVMAAILGAMWARWGIRHGDKWEKMEKQTAYYHHGKTEEKKDEETEEDTD